MEADSSKADLVAIAEMFSAAEQTMRDNDTWPTYERMSRIIEAEHGFEVSGQTIMNYHKKGEIKRHPNIGIVTHIAAFYGIPMEQLPEGIQRLAEQTLRGLVLVGAGTPDPTPASSPTPSPVSLRRFSARRNPNDRWSIPSPDEHGFSDNNAAAA